MTVPAELTIDGLHHVTSIASDAQANVDFYVGVLGLRLLKRSINQGNPEVYHLYYGDEGGHPGATMTCFVYPGLPRGRAGRGRVARVLWRLSSISAVEYWETRLLETGLVTTREDEDAVSVEDPDGLTHVLRLVTGTSDAPLVAEHPEIPREYALAGLHGVIAFHDLDAEVPDRDVDEPQEDARLCGALAEITGLDALLGVSPGGELRGPTRGGVYLPGAAPAAPGLRGAGTVHHVAWTIPDAAYAAWQARLTEAGVELVEVADRYYFRSLYFRTPMGVLFELATPTPGFTVDETAAELGTRLCIPPAFGARAAEIEAQLTPFTDPLETWRAQRAPGRPG